MMTKNAKTYQNKQNILKKYQNNVKNAENKACEKIIVSQKTSKHIRQIDINLLKRLALIFLVASLIFSVFISFGAPYKMGEAWQVALAEVDAPPTEQEIEKELDGQVERDLNEIDFSELDALASEIGEAGEMVFGGLSFKETVLSIIRGELVADFGGVLKSIANSALIGFKKSFSTLLLVLVVALLYCLYNNLLSHKQSGISDVVRIVCVGVIALIILTIASAIISKTTKTITTLGRQMNAIFPLLLTLMTAVGGASTVASFSPTIMFLSSMISNIFMHILLPLFTCVLVLSVVNCFSANRNFSRLNGFFKSLFKWIIGTVFTLFMMILSFKGATAGARDGISIKATKYAIKNYVPYLGGFVSDGFEMVRVSGILIKNSVGFGGILLLVATVIGPIISIALFSLSSRLLSGLVEPLGDSKVAEILDSVANAFKMLSAILIGVALMFLFSIVMIIITVNVI